MPNCNKPNMRKWVAALRSGKYSQMMGRLYDSRGACCLGVACETAIANGVEMMVDSFEVAGNIEYRSYDGLVSFLPHAVLDWLGLEASNPQIGRNVGATTANDSLRWSFEEIANSIEEYYELNED